MYGSCEFCGFFSELVLCQLPTDSDDRAWVCRDFCWVDIDLKDLEPSAPITERIDYEAETKR